MKGIIYTRVSSDEQVQGTSLAFQEELCRKYCRERDIEVLEVFREEGASAKTADRSELLRALEYCRKRKNAVQVFVVAKVDRFARNTEDHFYVRKLLFDYGVALHSVTEPIGNSPTEKFVETVLAASSEFDNAIRKQRCTDGMVARINQGIWPFAPPVGYRCQHAKKQGRKKTEPDPPDPEVFPIIQRGLKEYAKGTVHSFPELARLLDSWGLSEILGKPTTAQFVDRMLGRNLKFYAGILTNPWTGEETTGLHSPMIGEEELRQIVRVRSGNGRSSTKRARFNPLFPLRRIVMCDSCKRPLTAAVSRGNGGEYPYYECYNPECSLSRKTIPKALIERDFAEYLDRITPKERCLAVFEEAVLDVHRRDETRKATLAEQSAKRLRDLDARRIRIFEMREDGSYERDVFRKRLALVEAEIAAVKSNLDTAGGEPFDAEQALASTLSFIRNLSAEWLDMKPSLRPRFGKLVFPEGISYARDAGFRTTRLSHILAISQGAGGSLSQVVDFVRAGSNQIIEEILAWQAFVRSLDRDDLVDLAA